MDLYVLKAKFKPYSDTVQAVFPDEIGVLRIPYNKEEDFTEDLKKIKIRLELDHNDKKFASVKYIETDFYKGPSFINNETGGYNLSFYTVSPKMKTLLEQLNLPKHRFYPIMLTIDKGKELPYFILQIDNSMIPYTDVSKSSFYGLNIDTDEVLHYEEELFQTNEEMSEKIPSNIFVRDKSMYINQDLDWVYMAPYFMISEKAKKIFEENNLIDLDLKPFYELKSLFSDFNELGYAKEYAGREIIINGRSTMDGLDIKDFERKED